MHDPFSNERLAGLLRDQAQFAAALPANFASPTEAAAVGEKFDEWVQDTCFELMQKCDQGPGDEASEMQINLNEALLVATAIYIFVLMNMAAAISPADSGGGVSAKVKELERQGILFESALDNSTEMN